MYMANFEDELLALCDPRKFQEPLDLKNFSEQQTLDFYRSMFLIRRSEEEIADLSLGQEIKTPVHLAIGQEAIAVGISSSLTSDDKIYSGHRGHAHYLALGASLNGLFAEVMGKETGVCKGMGGSMHLYDPDVGFHGSVPIVGGTIPIAVGAALACKYDNEGAIALCYFGDGAAEEGVLHESLNLAKTMELPILFICENNLYSSHLDIDLRQPSNRISRFAEAHKIGITLLDGNDVISISASIKEVIKKMRASGGPHFLEAVTFRWRGHVGPDINLDVGVRRSKKELEAWMKRDPIERLKLAILHEKQSLAEEIAEIENDVNTKINEAIKFAKLSPYPPSKNLLDFVYSNGTF